MKDLPPYALCSFVAPEGAEEALSGEDQDSTLLPSVSGPAIGVEEDMFLNIIESTAETGSAVQLWPWVNQVCCITYFIMVIS
jgi:hypothetical protein